jgi:two-component system sensor histidine kinase KdpD
MKHGNVYPPDRTQVALDRFFTEANLTALRELALRLTARRVEDQLEESAAGERLHLVTDRVLVLVDGSTAAHTAIRAAAELAGALHAALVALVVVTPQQQMAFDRQRDLQEAIDDAVDVGATVLHIEASDVLSGLEQVARDRKVSHLVLPYQKREGLRRLTDRPLSEAVLDRLPGIQVHIVAG